MFSKKNRLISLIPLLTFGLISGCQQTTSSNNPTIIIPTVQEVAGNPDAAGPTPTDLAVITLAAPSTATVPNASATESAPLPTPDLTLTAAPFLPTRNPVPTPAIFQLTFSESADGSNPANSFTAPNEVFAIWEYYHLFDGYRLQRDWYLNDELFISREEIWDEATYGQNGTRNDVSIFDFETGLQPGNYRLEITVNDQLVASNRFTILTSTGAAEGEREPEIILRGFDNDLNDDRLFGEFNTVQEVFAVLEYSDLSAEDVITRDWYFNGRRFISREENWDFATYGSDGQRTDISLFDYETPGGLAPGYYELVVGINGKKTYPFTFTVLGEAGQRSQRNIAGVSFSDTPREFGLDTLFETPNEVFLIFDYNDMAPGDVVKREWFLNDEPFIMREEPWEFETFGAEGLRNDITIFDFDTGLTSGEYLVILSLNGEYQTHNRFTVQPFEYILPFTDPSGGRSVETGPGNVLTVRIPGQTDKTWQTDHRIVHLDWFPSGEKLVYTTQILTEPDAFYPSLRYRHEVWLLDIESGSQTRLATTDDNLHHPLVSPDGLAIAFLKGTGFGDACFVDSNLMLLRLDQQGNVIQQLEPVDFPSLQTIQTNQADGATTWVIKWDNSYQAQSAGIYSSRQASPGRWLDGETFEADIGWNICVQDTLGGRYGLNVATQTATKLE